MVANRCDFHFLLVWYKTWTQTHVGQPENIEFLKTLYKMKNRVPPRVQPVIICHMYLANLACPTLAGPGVYQAPPSSHPRNFSKKLDPKKSGPEIFQLQWTRLEQVDTPSDI